MATDLTVGSLFSGIGGLELGLERAGMIVRWQVEIDDYARRVLAKHWPDVPRYEDVRDVGQHNLEAVDVICGGFPCQDVSLAGKRAGLEGKRTTLWSEFTRIIRELKPRWVVAENVPGLLSSDNGRFFGRVLRDLAESGYDAEWQVLPASAFGAWHRRDRVFIVAYARCNASERFGGLGQLAREASAHQGGEEERQWIWDAAGSSSETIPDAARGQGYRRDRGSMAGAPERRESSDTSAKFGSENVADTKLFDCGAKVFCREARGANTIRPTSGLGRSSWWEVEPDVGRNSHGLPDGMDRLGDLTYQSHKCILTDGIAISGGIDYADAEKERTGEILRVLWSQTEAQDVSGTARGFVSFQSSEVLQSDVCQQQETSEELGNAPLAGATTSQRILRSVWHYGEFACTSCGRQLRERRSGEYPDALRLVSQLLACNCGATRLGATWQDAFPSLNYWGGDWERGVPRVVDGVPSRVDRLKCLGNAVVPQVAEYIGWLIVEADGGN